MELPQEIRKRVEDQARYPSLNEPVRLTLPHLVGWLAEGGSGTGPFARPWPSWVREATGPTRIAGRTCPPKRGWAKEPGPLCRTRSICGPLKDPVFTAVDAQPRGGDENTAVSDSTPRSTTRPDMIRQMQEIARSTRERQVPRHGFLRKTGLSERQVNMLFGTYNDLVRSAGLEPQFFPRAGVLQYSDDELLEEVARVLRLPEAKLTRVFFEQNAEVSTSVCERRFGDWLGTLRAARARLNDEDDATLLKKLDAYTYTRAPDGFRLASAPAVHNGGGRQEADEYIAAQNDELLLTPAIPVNTLSVYGDFINFRGLQHAPVNVFCCLG